MVSERCAARAWTSFGMITVRRASNGRMSRKNDVSLVVIASITSVTSGEFGDDFMAAANWCRSRMPWAWAIGTSRDSTRYSLPVSSTMAERSRTIELMISKSCGRIDMSGSPC